MTRVRLLVVVALLATGLYAGAVAPGASAQDGDTTTSTTSAPTTEVPTTSAPSTTAVPATAPTTPAPTTTAPAPSETTSTTTSTTTTVPPVPSQWSLAPIVDEPFDDTIQSTQAMYDRVTAALGELTGRRNETRIRLMSDRARRRAVAAERVGIQQRRTNRAVAAFLQAGTTETADLSSDLDDMSAMAMLRSMESSDVDRGRELTDRLSGLDGSIAAAEASLPPMEADVARLSSAQAMLQGKLNGAVDVSQPVPVGPSEVAAAAAWASAAVREAMAALLARDAAATAAALGVRNAAFERLALLVADPADPTSAPQLTALWRNLGLRPLAAMLFALAQVGKPYVYATAGPDTFDCSGLTMRAWATGGVRLGHFSGAQAVSGPPVPPDQLQPGDLLTYGPLGNQHVTMYIGAGRVVEAKGRAYGVVVSPANLANLTVAARIVTEPFAPPGGLGAVPGNPTSG